MAEPLQSTKSGANAIATVNYTHDAMIDFILANPNVSQGAVAAKFGFTEGWVSRVMGSDAFNARLAARKTELVDPVILQSLEEKITGLAHQSLEIISDKLQATKNPDLAIKAFDLSTKALGFGARAQNVAQQNNTYVVALPQKVVDEKDWAQQAQDGAKDLARRAEAARQSAIDVESKEV